MRSSQELDLLRQQAVMLRRQGKSRSQIKQLLHIGSNGTLNEVLKGEPPPGWSRRPNAKDDLRIEARSLRSQGLKYQQIAAQLGVSKSSISLWVRDLPRPPRLSYEASRRRSAEGVHRYWEAERAAREANRSAAHAAAATQIGSLTIRELLIAGVIAYWCEGAKSKPYRHAEEVNFINSDPAVILFFLRFLDLVGISRQRIRYRVHIHETADSQAATQYWADLVGATMDQFVRPNIKRHNPRTSRKTTGAEYRGCLQIRVLRSCELYRKIAGWAAGIMAATA